MSNANFHIAQVIAREGGYVNHPADRGGETKYGISKRANPDIDVRNLTPEKAAAIYKPRYWDTINADALPPELQGPAFDTSVLHGPAVAKRLIAESGGDPVKFIELRKQREADIVAKNPSQKVFAKGWQNRTNSLVPAGATAGGAVASGYTVQDFIDGGWGQDVAWAKQQGYSDAEIVDNLSRVQGELRSKQDKAQSRQVAAGDAVARAAATSKNIESQLSALIQAGYGKDIDWARQQGYSPEEIVDTLAPHARARGDAARQESEKAGALGRFGNQLTTGLGNVGRSLSQIGSVITGDTEGAQRKKQEQQAINNDLRNVADRSTIAGTVGNIAGEYAPDIGMAIATFGASTPGSLARAGAKTALVGSLARSDATTLPELASNTAVQTLAGGVGGAAVGKAVQVLPKAAAATGRGIQNVRKPGAAQRAADNEALTREYFKRAGSDATTLNPETARVARTATEQKLNEAMRGVSTTADDVFKPLQDALESGQLPKAFADEVTPLLFAGRANGVPLRRAGEIAVEELDDIATQISKRTWKQRDSLSRAEHAQVQNVLDGINSRIEDALSKAGRLEAYTQGKSQNSYAKVITKIAKHRGFDPDAPVADSVESAYKSGWLGNQFEKNKAPGQDIIRQIQETKNVNVNNVLEIGTSLLDVVPIVGQPVRATGVIAKRFIEGLRDPATRFKFESTFTPVEQAKIMSAAGRAVGTHLPQASATLPESVQAPTLATAAKPSRFAKTRAAMAKVDAGEEQMQTRAQEVMAQLQSPERKAAVAAMPVPEEVAAPLPEPILKKAKAAKKADIAAAPAKNTGTSYGHVDRTNHEKWANRVGVAGYDQQQARLAAAGLPATYSPGYKGQWDYKTYLKKWNEKLPSGRTYGEAWAADGTPRLSPEEFAAAVKKLGLK